MFITFEGVEGAGKTTQIRMLGDRLLRSGRAVLLTREPGDGPIGPDLRRLVLQPPADAIIDDRTELLIMLADRAQHVSNVIAPALQRGDVVLCDRFVDSSSAYQGYGRGIDITMIDSLNRFATAGTWPDRTLLLDLDTHTGLGRQRDRNRMEMQSSAFHERVRAGFLAIAAAAPDRVITIDATGSAEDVHERIWSALSTVVSP